MPTNQPATVAPDHCRNAMWKASFSNGEFYTWKPMSGTLVCIRDSGFSFLAQLLALSICQVDRTIVWLPVYEFIRGRFVEAVVEERDLDSRWVPVMVRIGLNYFYATSWRELHPPLVRTASKKHPSALLKACGGCFSENLASPFPLPTMHYHPSRRYENRFLLHDFKSTRGIKSETFGHWSYCGSIDLPVWLRFE